MKSMKSVIIYKVTLAKEKSLGSFYISLPKGNIMTASEQKKWQQKLAKAAPQLSPWKLVQLSMRCWNTVQWTQSSENLLGALGTQIAQCEENW